MYKNFKEVVHAVSADSLQQEIHGRRVKRFLFNKVNEPNITYGAVTLCCECDDFDESNSCHKNCRTGSGYGSMKPCMGQLCSTTATLINDQFYIVSGCVSEKICQDERTVYAQTKGCQTMLKEEMSNGTKCGYCCRDLDLTVHGTSHNSDCLNNLDKLVAHAYDQNIMPTTTTTAAAATTTTTIKLQASTTPSAGKATTTDAIHKTSMAIDNTKPLSNQQIKQICTARTDNKPDFPYPGDETKYIKCNEFGSFFIMSCPDGTVWDDQAQTCYFGHSHITRQVSTKAITSLLQTTLKRTTTFTAFSQDTMTTPSRGTLTTSSSSNDTSATSTVSSTIGRIGVTCQTCTNDSYCDIKTCQSTDAYCLNVVRVYANESQTVTKKSCASFYECEFDHSLRSSQCDTARQSRNASVSNKGVLCQYCCKATNSSPPCNIRSIPDKIDWFQVGKRKKRHKDRQWIEVKSKMIVMLAPAEDQEPPDNMGPTSSSYPSISTTQSHPTAAATTRHPAGAIVASKVVGKNGNSTKKVRRTTVFPKVTTPSRINNQQVSSRVDIISEVPNAHETEAVIESNGEHESEVGNEDTVKQPTVHPKINTPSETNDRQENLSEDGKSEVPNAHETEEIIEYKDENEHEAEIVTEDKSSERGENGTNATFERLMFGKSFAPNVHVSICVLLVNAIVSFLFINLFCGMICNMFSVFILKEDSIEKEVVYRVNIGTFSLFFCKFTLSFSC